MKITLNLPPSVNSMYRHVGNRVYKTREAKDWITEAGWELMSAKIKPVKGKVYVGVHLYLKRDSDIDNRLKAILDLLEEQRIIENDSQVYHLTATKDKDIKNPRVEVEIVKL